MSYIHDVNDVVAVQPNNSVGRQVTYVSLSQNENGRRLHFRIVGTDIPTGSIATLAGTKPDGNVYSKAGTIDGNTVIVEEDIQMTAVAGIWDAKLNIVKSSI